MNVCPDDIFWFAEPFTWLVSWCFEPTKLGMVMHHYEPDCLSKRFGLLSSRSRLSSTKKLRLNRVTLNQVRKSFCVEDEENWAQHKTLWYTIGKAWDLQDIVIDDDWVCSTCQIGRKPGERSTRDAIQVLESVKMYAVVNCVKRQLKDPRMSEEKHCRSQVQKECHLLF